MSLFFGVDTSNYTTSVAIFDSDKGIVSNSKKLLPVDDGEVGLMQSKALFEHVRQLPSVTEAAFSCFNKNDVLTAGAVSSTPRDVDGSYMPVFLAGISCATAIAASHCIPLYKTNHQAGHVAAALYSADRFDLFNKRFIAFHLSGGTTEALLVEPNDEKIFKITQIARTLDLKAGQVIDRVGVMLCLSFRAGAMLDKLAVNGKLRKKPNVCLKGCNCCLSGVENICKRMIDNGYCKEDVARYAIEHIYETLYAMIKCIKDEFSDLPMVFAGGVMSNSIIRSRLSEKGAIFAKPEFSSDNAAGVAVLSYLLYSKREF